MNNIVGKFEPLPSAIQRIKQQTAMGIWNGRDYSPYFESCRWFIEHYHCSIIFTKDIGYHSCGWWKNPLYERCYHLSICFMEGRDKKAIEHLIALLFGVHKNLIWIEPPYSDQGKRNEIWHYRLFCDENWQPILPKGEVYSTQFTERGWKSFSELNYHKSKA